MIKLLQIIEEQQKINHYIKNEWFDIIDFTILENLYNQLPNTTLTELKTILSIVDYELIKNFYSNDLEKAISNIDIDNYIKAFREYFIESRAGILMKRQWIINKDFQIDIINEIVFINFWKNQDLDFRDYINKNNIYKEVNTIKYWRIFLPNDNILILKKTPLKKDWSNLQAIKDSLNENKLIFKKLKIKN